ncbi:MAG: hypothetical protein JNN30_09195, partial [Rhodanobacteraceae bacterium]|nr:hypothetical protein [Rhodanobacteraceae bacterium]
GSDGFGSDGFGSDGFGSDGFGSDGFGSDGFGSDSFGSDSFGSDSFGSDGFGSDGFGSDSFGSDSFGSDSFGSGTNRPDSGHATPDTGSGDRYCGRDPAANCRSQAGDRFLGTSASAHGTDSGIGSACENHSFATGRAASERPGLRAAAGQA